MSEFRSDMYTHRASPSHFESNIEQDKIGKKLQTFIAFKYFLTTLTTP